MVGIATLFLLILYLGLRVFPSERLKLASELFPSGSVVKFLSVHKVYIFQLMMVMATELGWAMFEAEVFTGVTKTGIIHGLLFQTKFFSLLPLIVQYHPKYDIQDGILALALLNAFYFILIAYLLSSKAKRRNVRIGQRQITDISDRRLSRRPWDDDHYGGTSGPSSARSRAGPESPLLPRIPGVHRSKGRTFETVPEYGMI
ncbi:hypothetical protein MACK_003501 [Theileria orientalis]|uniref:Uncharacterized protein n=1 Tax=Theileria orientalis TaxID=68886 RepID=A0A976SJ74_THEOR|nr:hypothetical protein MACK_003501 [Theileria orientalis]